jgi:hypothetical protein
LPHEVRLVRNGRAVSAWNIQAGEIRLTSAFDREWLNAQRSNDFERAWDISDRNLRELCASGAAKHSGDRHRQRIWRGEKVEDKRVLIRCYHGLGDTIQFIRFAKRLREIAQEVIVWGQPELLPVLRGVEGVDHAIALHDGTPKTDYDVDIEVMELAHALRATPDLIAARVPYLACDPAQVTRPLSSSAFKVGLVCEAGSWDRRRSVPPRLLGRLQEETGLRLFSLQQGPGRSMTAAIPAEDIAQPTIEALAAMIMELDLVITVDTMVAHLAGALGAPVWTMLHHDCDWRWPKAKCASPWYPTMKLFHQKTPGEWTDVIDEIIEELRENQSRHSPRDTGNFSRRAPA